MDFLHAKRLILFLSTPSGWRATTINANCPGDDEISIHALRVEGDYINKLEETHRNISIHALRVEGDCQLTGMAVRTCHFYPRPPGGGRPPPAPRRLRCPRHFYPRPPGGGRPPAGCRLKFHQDISIHALRVEGDRVHTAIRSRPPISIHALRVEGDGLSRR